MSAWFFYQAFKIMCTCQLDSFIGLWRYTCAQCQLDSCIKLLRSCGARQLDSFIKLFKRFELSSILYQVFEICTQLDSLLLRLCFGLNLLMQLHYFCNLKQLTCLQEIGMYFSVTEWATISMWATICEIETHSIWGNDRLPCTRFGLCHDVSRLMLSSILYDAKFEICVQLDSLSKLCFWLEFVDATGWLLLT